jgi:hypothetical protein
MPAKEEQLKLFKVWETELNIPSPDISNPLMEATSSDGSIFRMNGIENCQNGHIDGPSVQELAQDVLQTGGTIRPHSLNE